MQVLPDDEVSRCIIFKKAFISGIHVDEVLFVFPDSPRESGVIRRLASKDSDVHRIGCKIARGQNTRLGNPPPGPKRRYYCGFRTAEVSAMVLSGNDYVISLTHQPEGGEESHVDFEINLAAGLTRNERATTKLEAGLILAEAFGAAVAHICEEDQQDGEHPINRDPSCLTRGFPRVAGIDVNPPSIG